MIAYEVTHRTEYHYESDVSHSYGQLHVLPRELPEQRCRSAEVVIVPEPEDYAERIDFFGNRVSFMAIHEPHRKLSVTATSVVEVDRRVDAGPSPACHRPWEEVRESLRRAPGDRMAAGQFSLDSPLVTASARFARYASASFTAGRDFLDAVADLSHRIHTEFEYKPGATSVTTPVDEAFELREGVCQDFAHLAIACLRSIGLPARYVSGYLETDPPPGRPKLRGADASHAWLAVLVPDFGWLDVDPTNDQFGSNRYVVAAFGRDYSDVPPLSGVIYTEGRTKRLNVVVDVVALAA
ncbi:MAG TPA: transglutaminase family protein [Solirubrobacteraceae bacterium]|jgi:transglutaminase-like putative cysteine protease|nr:transglutaminase family protein [Solirubrobacteraceae bacterium]